MSTDDDGPVVAVATAYAPTLRAWSDGEQALFNLEWLAGLFTLGKVSVTRNGGLRVGDRESLAAPEETGPGLRMGDRWGSLEEARGSVLGVLWASQILDDEQPKEGAAPGDTWRDVAELLGATVDFVQGFLGRWRGGVLGEVTANSVRLDADETGALHRTEDTFKAKRVRRECFLDAAGAGRLETVKVGDEVRELLVLDVLLAELLAELGQEKAAAKVRATPIEERGKRWIRQPGPDGNWLEPKACTAVVKAIWARVKAERTVPKATLLQLEHGGSSYVQAPKVIGGIAWAFGTEGQKVAEPAEVVDGDEYRAAPKVARYVSRSIGLVPDGRLKQGLLPVETTAEALAVRVLADSQAVVSGVGGKVALLLAVLSPLHGLCRMSVDELCRQLWPAAKRGPQLRDRQAAVKATLALRELFVVLPNTVNFRLWDIAAPDSKTPTGELPITFGWSKNAEAQELGGAAAGMLRGRFLLNLSGAMRLAADHALELRTYLHAAAGWNEARRGEAFDPAFAPKGTAEEIAARVNALSAPAVQYLAERGKGRRQAAADDKRRLIQALERLADEAELIRLEKGGRGVLRLLPPGGLLEAYELMRKHGPRRAK